MGQRARDVMTPNPSVCLESDSIQKAVQIFRNEDCGAVPIINKDGKCTGIITDRDVCLYVVLNRVDPEKTSVRDAMTPSPVTCGLDEELDRVLDKMEKHQIRRIPVVEKDGKCVGIIAQADVALGAEKKEQVAELLEEVSR